MELWDVYDRNRMKTGRTMVRGEEFAPGEYHLVVHACIFNEAGQMLIQQRQPFKSGWPNFWDVTVGGSSVAGETSQNAIEREVSEEIGLTIDMQKVRPNLTVNFDCGFDDIYLLRQNVDISTLTLQEEEVQAVKWATEDEILKMIDEGIFIPYYKSLISVFFQMCGHYGCEKE